MRVYQTGLIFDLDGTLVDSFEGIHHALMQTHQALGLPVHDLARTKSFVGHGLEQLLAKSVGSERVGEAFPIYRAFYADVVDATRPLPGADALIRHAAALGVKLALASNKLSIFSERILETLGWRDLFHAVLGPDRVSHPKPHPAMLLEAVRLLGPGHVLYVGDMDVDLQAGRAANVPVALVANGGMSRESLTSAGAENVFADLLALREWLDSH